MADGALEQAYRLEVQKEKAKLAAQDRAWNAKYSVPLKKSEIANSKYSNVSNRISSVSSATGTAMRLFSFLKPVIIFLVVVFLVFGLGWSAVQQIVFSIGYWWFALIFLGIVFWKYR